MRITAERERVKETYNNWLKYWANAPWIERLSSDRNFTFLKTRCHFFMTKKNKQCTGYALFHYQSFDGPEFYVCGRHMMKWLWSPNEEKRARKYIRLNPPPWTGYDLP